MRFSFLLHTLNRHSDLFAKGLHFLFGDVVTDEVLFYEERVTWKSVFTSIILNFALLLGAVLFTYNLMLQPLIEQIVSGEIAWTIIFVIFILLTGAFFWPVIFGAVVVTGVETVLEDICIIRYGESIRLRLDSKGLTYYENKASHFKAWEEVTDISYKNYPTAEKKVNFKLLVTFSDATHLQLEKNDPKKFIAKFEQFWYTYSAL